MISSYVSYKSSEHLQAQSCIKRLDDQEKLIREKAEIMLGDLGYYIGETAKSGASLSDMANASQKVISSSFKLTAYTPIELSAEAVNLAGVINLAMSVESKADRDKAVARGSTALREWPDRYSALMQDFQAQRSNCL
jgi:hypothetical protein